MEKPTFQTRKGLVSASIFERRLQGKNGFFVSKSIALNISIPNNDGTFKQNTLTIVKKDFDDVLDVLEEIKKNI